MDLEQAAARAAKAIRVCPRGTRWFLASDSDADGICAAGVMAHALRRIGHGVQMRASRQKDAAFYASLAQTVCDGYILLDKGSSHLDELAQLHRRTDRPVLVIDHHGLPETVPDGLVVVNPRGLGLDGSRDASAATTAAAVALALDPANVDLVPIALAGAVGDWQHRGGWQGWNARLIDMAQAAGHLERRLRLGLIGIDLPDALLHAGLPGFVERATATAFLAPLGLDEEPDAEGLDDEAQGRLLSGLVLHQLAQGRDVAPETLLREALWDPARRLGVRHLFRLMDAAGRQDHADRAFGFLLGPGDRTDLEADFRRYAKALGAAVGRLAADGADARTACQVAWTDDPRLTGMVGGIGVTHVLADKRRPAVVLADRPDGDVQVSTRGTHEAVAAGLDLGHAVQVAARSVGRDGGGHPVAAGTVVAPDVVDAFLDALDALLDEQGFLATTSTAPDTL